MDKTLIRQRFSRSVKTYGTQAIVQAQIAKEMTRIMQHHGFPQNAHRIFEFGCGAGGFTAEWTSRFKPQTVFLNDLCPEVSLLAQNAVNSNVRTNFLEGDVEHLELPSDLEAIVSCSAIQWLEHPNTFLHRCAQALCRNGLLVFSTFGPENVREMASLTGTALHYPSLQDWDTILQSDFDIIHKSEELRQLTFDTPIQVLHHLKATGVTGIHQSRWSKSSLNEFSNKYCKYFGTDAEGVSLTYHPMYFIARKK